MSNAALAAPAFTSSASLSSLSSAAPVAPSVAVPTLPQTIAGVRVEDDTILRAVPPALAATKLSSKKKNGFFEGWFNK